MLGSGRAEKSWRKKQQPTIHHGRGNIIITKYKTGSQWSHHKMTKTQDWRSRVEMRKHKSNSKSSRCRRRSRGGPLTTLRPDSGSQEKLDVFCAIIHSIHCWGWLMSIQPASQQARQQCGVETWMGHFFFHRPPPSTSAVVFKEFTQEIHFYEIPLPMTITCCSALVKKRWGERISF